MTINVSELRAVLRAAASEAQLLAARELARGHELDFQFNMGRHAGFLTAMHKLAEAENEAALERSEALARRARSHVEAAVGQGVNLEAVERLEEFARTAGGAVDMASGTVHSDAEGGL